MRISLRDIELKWKLITDSKKVNLHKLFKGTTMNKDNNRYEIIWSLSFFHQLKTETE